MSLENVQTVLENFISDTHNDLLILKGRWGIGKTFFWRRLIKESRLKKIVGRQWYSYVSLFGVNSLDDLKNAIIASRVEANVSIIKSRIQMRTESLKQLLKGLEKTKLGSYTGGLAGEYLYLLLDNSLICFDDLERKGAALSFKDVFGLAAVLKEERDCKVLIIMNDESLSDTDIKEFKIHGEKLVDREVSFKIDEEQAFRNIFEALFPYYEILKKHCLSLHIRNMRILKRVKRSMEDLSSVLRGSENQIIEEVIHSLILYVWSYNDKEDQAPPLSFIRSYSLAQKFIRTTYKKAEETAQVKHWDEILGSYNYLRTNSLDEHLIDFVTSGSLDIVPFRSELEKRNLHHRILKADANYNEVWDLYRNTFANNEDEFLDELLNRFRRNMKVLSISELRDAVSTLRQFERDEPAKQLIDEYFKVCNTPQDIQTFKSLRRTMIDREQMDEYLMERLEDIWETEDEDTRSLADVFRANSLKENWSFRDVLRINSFSADDYYSFFKSENSRELYYYVRTCLDFGLLTDEKGVYKSVSEKTKEALTRIKSESRINQVRLSSLYRVDLP
jgi:hypothetical protein